ncbi:MAG: type VI secretion system baseplate subunit TssE [Gammaproteobacteria bacterium]|nr:type VI secretion system baseplate subunit TssE [Gammaproteobacteria bacterium]
MARVTKTQELKPSVLDRLLDPQAGASGTGSSSVNMSKIRDALRRDLENLLNTRRPYRVGRERMGGSLTIVDYGVPDFTGASFSTQLEQERLVKEIRHVIENYEKRFKSVRVTERKKMDNLDRTVHFRIEAELRVEPAVEPLVFDTRIDPVSRELDVEDAVDG